jgi:hypothetical protein
MKIILVEAEFFLSYGQTHSHDEGDCRSSRLEVKHPRNNAISFTIKRKNYAELQLQKWPSLE